MFALCCFVLDYHQDILNLSLQEFSRPDVVNIAEHADPSDLGRLLQLVLSKLRGWHWSEIYDSFVALVTCACAYLHTSDISSQAVDK